MRGWIRFNVIWEKLDCGILLYVINRLILKTNQKQWKPKSRKHKEKFSVFVREYELFRPEIKTIVYTINNFSGDCYNTNFHTFKLSCIYDIERTNGNFATGIVSDKKLKQIVRESVFLREITIKSFSSPSKIKIGF